MHFQVEVKRSLWSTETFEYSLGVTYIRNRSYIQRVLIELGIIVFIEIIFTMRKISFLMLFHSTKFRYFCHHRIIFQFCNSPIFHEKFCHPQPFHAPQSEENDSQLHSTTYTRRLIVKAQTINFHHDFCHLVGFLVQRNFSIFNWYSIFTNSYPWFICFCFFFCPIYRCMTSTPTQGHVIVVNMMRIR